LEGKCTRGKKCTFAHGDEDKEDQSQPLCMKLCKTLIATGRCKNPNCKYAHSKEDMAAAKQLTDGLVDSQQTSGSAVMPSESGQPIGQRMPLAGSSLNTQNNVRWGLGFLWTMRWVCPQRASHRMVVAPPGVLELPGAGLAAVSYPAMQTAPAELPAAHPFEENSFSVSPESAEPAFHVVVKNTFIDIVETSPRAIHRSRSEPPRSFMSSDREKRPRCQTAVEDVAVSYAEKQRGLPEAALAMEIEEPSEVSPCTQECAVPSSSVEVPQPQHFTREDSIEDGRNPVTVVKTSRGKESAAFSSMTFPAFEVRNTFIEVCEGLPKADALRPVKSDADLLALERESLHQAQN
jgi:hypothetical protein